MAFDIHKAILFAFIVCLLAAVPGHARDYTAAVLRSGFQGEDPALIESLEETLQGAGYTVGELDFAGICDPNQLRIERFDLLVLPNAASLPAKSAQTIQAFLRAGGDIIALNAPMWQRALINVGGKWLTREEYQIQQAVTPPEHILFDFTPETIKDWQRASNEVDVGTTAETVADGPAPGQRALHVVIPNLTSWDTFGAREIKNAFPNGDALTVFSAKGGPDTSQLAIEWAEKDGSRWLAVVALTPEWRQYVLTPQDFRYWISVPNRGGRGDLLRPENAVSMSIGLAFTHTTGIQSGRHEYWVGPFGTAKMTPEYEELLQAIEPPALDTLSPSYKLFDMNGVAKLSVRRDQAVLEWGDLPVPDAIRSVQPRPKGGGFDKGRSWRWIPLLEGRSAKGEWRGNPASLLIQADGEYKGGVWASFGIGDTKWYKDPTALKMIGAIAARMKIPIWLVDGGTRHFTYFDGQELMPGIRAVNFSNERHTDVVGKVSFAAHGESTEDFSESWGMDLKPGEIGSVSGSVLPKSWPDAGYDVTAELLLANKVIDKVTHEINVWKPKKIKEFVTVKDGEFMLGGKRWRAHGINFMPSSGIGTEDGEYFEHYLSAGSYDPEVFQRDIEHLRDMGFNTVSIFCYAGIEKAQNLLDLLRRLDALGMKADLSLRYGTPFDFYWPQVGDIIKNSRLRENDTVFAYDLAWEPSFGSHDERVRWDAEWEKWIVERYGSIANAEKDWGFALPRDESGKVTNPFPQQVDTDGEWRRMTAAYRRFLDTLLYDKYGLARRLIRGVDPNHLVSFRMSETANPTYRWDGRITYDFPYLAGAVDILSPEAYGRIGDWEKVKPGWFEFEWGRLSAPMKPFMWKEMGCSTWDVSRMRNSQSRLDFQAMFYESFYRMMISTGTDGIFFWWYPGGFRVGENSDYGIINPDGTDRPVTKVIRANARKFLDGPSTKPVDHWITVDRDAHPDGVSGIYDQVKSEFWKAVDKGKTPGLRTPGTGTDSSNCPLVAVGNTKCNGANPPKYLDAFLDVVRVKDSSGRWVAVEKGGSVKVAADRPVLARIEFTNLGEAKLLSPMKCSRPGAVVIVVKSSAGEYRIAIPTDVPHLGSSVVRDVPLSSSGVTSPTEIVITFDAQGRTPFGERFRLMLEPR